MKDSLNIVRKFYPDVQTIKQAKRNLPIEVMRQDMTTKGRKKHDQCVMAEACKRSLHADGAIISLGTAYIIRGKTATRYKVPQAVSREIVSYDRGSSFEPGLYTLYVPQVQRAKQPETHKVLPRPSGRRKPAHLTSNVRMALSA